MIWFIAAAGGIFYLLFKGTAPAVPAATAAKEPEFGSRVESSGGEARAERGDVPPGSPAMDEENEIDLPRAGVEGHKPYDPSTNPFRSMVPAAAKGHKGSYDDVMPTPQTVEEDGGIDDLNDADDVDEGDLEDIDLDEEDA